MQTHYRPAKAWVITMMLAIFMLVNFLDKVIVGLIAVPMMEELNLSPSEYGVVAGSFFWLFAISGVCGGFLADRFKTKWLLLGMAIIWSVAQLPMIYSSSMIMIIAARVVLGMGEGPAWPVSVHACYKWFPDSKRNLPVSIVGQGPIVGLLVAGVTVPLISSHWGWRANFLILSVIGITWGLLWLKIGAEGSVSDDKAARDDSQSVQQRVPYRKLFSDRTVIANFILHFVAYWGLALNMTWLPAYLQKGLGYDAITTGQLFAFIIAINIPLNVGLSWWSQRMLAKGASTRLARAIFASFWLMVSGLLFVTLMMFDMSNVQKVLLIAVATGLPPIIYSLGPAMLGEVVPDSQRGAILAIDNSVASLAGMLAPMVTGYLVQAAMGAGGQGYEQGFAIGGMLLVGGGLFGLLWANPGRSAAQIRSAVVPVPG